MILFCPAVPPSPPSAPSLVPRNATSFVSLLAKLLVLRACLLLSSSAREKEKEERSSRERTHSSPFVPSTLSLFLLLSLFPSSGPPSRTPPFLTQLSPFLPFSLFLSFSLPLIPTPQCYRSRVSPRSHSFSSSPSSEALLLGGSRIPRRCPLPFLPAGSLILPRVVPFPPEFAPECISLPYRHRHLHRAVPASPFLRRPFLSLSIAVCSALFEFKRGSRRCLVSPS